MSGPGGRVAFITGASRGIGAATARRLACDGFAVAINTHPDPLMRAAADQVAGQIRAEGDRGRISRRYQQRRGRGPALHLVRSGPRRCQRTGAERGVGPASGWREISEPEWDEYMAVNLKGAFLCGKRAFGADRAGRGGVIVTISSVLAKTGAASSLHYATTKAGLIGFTRSLARELGPAGIRVNCVLPGAIKTEAAETVNQSSGPVIDARVRSGRCCGGAGARQTSPGPSASLSARTALS